MTRVLVACAPFKGTLSAIEACDAVGRAVGAGGHDVVSRPLPDGGEGTAAVLGAAWGATEKAFMVPGVLGQTTDATVEIRVPIGVHHGRRRAIVESALCVGLTLVPPDHRQPLTATTASLGALLTAVIEDGVDDLFVALGGTGTVDGGRGLLAVLPSLPPSVTLTALVDVQAPLGGPNGARRFFGQKGVPEDAFDDVEAALCALHPRFIDTPGAGAAGGLGAAMLALGGTLRSGADFMMEACDLEGAVVASDVVVGGEGSVDVTTTFGKSLWRLRALARKHHKPFIVVCGHSDLPTVDVGDAVLELGEAGLRDARGTIAAIGPSLLAAIDRATDVVTPRP